MSVSQLVSAPLVQSDMKESLLDASLMANEIEHEYGGTLICMVGGPTGSVTDSHQCMVGEETAYQYQSNVIFDDAGAGPSYVVATMEHVEYESNGSISLYQPHAYHARVGGLRTAVTDTTLFENKTTVSYDPNPIHNEDEDDDVESDGSDSGESSAEEDVTPHKVPLVPEFGFVDASDNDEVASHRALPEHLFFDENEELKKKMIFGSKEQI